MSEDNSGMNVCRDFMRGNCNRGARCRYSHSGGGASNGDSLKNEAVFCHDFQNTYCNRPNCRFVHGSKEEETRYQQTGERPDQKVVNLVRSVEPRGGRPSCKDFRNGLCTRGDRCKFVHDRGESLSVDMGSVGMHNLGMLPPTTVRIPFGDPDSYEIEVKRRRMIEGVEMLDSRVLGEENSLLRRKIAALEKQVSDLTATNEVLLEQNARYRMAHKGLAVPTNLNTLPNALVSLSQPIVSPAVTLATLAHTTHMQPLQLTAAIPAECAVAQAQPMVIAAELSGPAPQPQQQQAVAVAAAPAASQQAPPPQQAPAPQNPHVPAPNSVNMVSMRQAPAPMVAASMQSMARPPVTMGMASHATMGVMASIAPSSSMISYPMVSHAMPNQ